jgi:chromosome partitioning protein
MTKIIAISNHKGGVGKTTSTVNIGAALNQLKKKVLVIDLDPQANLTQSLGIPEDKNNNIYGAIMGDYTAEPREILKGFHIIPATTDLAAAELELASKIDREFFLKDLLEPIKESYDYILIDCPPSLSILTLNALTASDEIIIPLQSEFLASKGMSKLVEIIKMVNKRLNPALVIRGVFLTQYDGRKLLNQNIFELVQEHFESELFDTKIRDNVALAEAPASGKDIFRYNPKSFGAEDYQNLAKEIIKRHKK